MFDDKEPSGDMQTRVLLAFALSALVLVIFGPKPGQKPQPKQPAAVLSPSQASPSQASPSQAAPVPTPSSSAPASTPAASSQPASAKPMVVMQESRESDVTVESDLYEVHFSNRGAVVTGWILKNFTDKTGKLLDLVNPVAVGQVGWPLSVYTEDPDVRS